MIQTSIRAEARRIVRDEQKQAKLAKRSFAIANDRLAARGKPPRSKPTRKPGTLLEYLLDAQDRGELATIDPQILKPFLKDLQRRAKVLMQRKVRQQFGRGKYWPAGKHKNCDKRGISPKHYLAAVPNAAESEAA